MTHWRAIAIASCVGLLGASFLPSSKADEWNKKTVLTISEQLMVPGATLEPGKYVMKLMDSQSNRHIVQVFNEDESKLITTALAIPNYRLQPTGETQFGFWEMPGSQPRALRSWFYPGDNFGQEFAFPKEEAAEIAKATHEPVPAIVSQGEIASAEVKRINPEGQREGTAVERPATTSSAQQEAQTQAQSTEPQSQAQSETSRPTESSSTEPVSPQTTAQPQAQSPTTLEQPATSSPVTSPQREQLPSTASPYPLAGLAGLLALGAAAAARVASKRVG